MIGMGARSAVLFWYHCKNWHILFSDLHASDTPTSVCLPHCPFDKGSLVVLCNPEFFPGFIAWVCLPPLFQSSGSPLCFFTFLIKLWSGPGANFYVRYRLSMTFVRIPIIATIWYFSTVLEFSNWPEAEGVTFRVSSNMRGQHFDRAVLVFFSPVFPRGIIWVCQGRNLKSSCHGAVVWVVINFAEVAFNNAVRQQGSRIYQVCSGRFTRQSSKPAV